MCCEASPHSRLNCCVVAQIVISLGEKVSGTIKPNYPKRSSWVPVRASNNSLPTTL